MSLSIVQHKAANVQGGPSLSVTLDAPPTPGNLLVAFVSYAASPVTDPSGTWLRQTADSGSNPETGSNANKLLLTTHVVQGGDGATWAWGGTGLYGSVELYEITGADPVDPVDQLGSRINNPATVALTPTVIGTLPLAAFAQDDGAGSVTAVSGGWALDDVQAPAFVRIAGAHATSLTADTSTPIQPTFTTGAANSAVTMLVLIAPGTGGPTYDETPTIAEAGATITGVDYFSQILRPTTDGPSHWTPSTGSNRAAMIDEVTADDADYIESAPTGTMDTEQLIQLPPSPTGVPPTPRGTGSHRFNYRYVKSASGGDQVDLRVRLYRANGTTVIAEQTVTDIDTVTTATLVLTGTEADSIPDADYGIGLWMGFKRL